jgi:hypothetical protein
MSQWLFATNNNPILPGSRVQDTSNDSSTGGEWGTVTELGTGSWTGYAWVVYDRCPSEWVDMDFLEAL